MPARCLSSPSHDAKDPSEMPACPAISPSIVANPQLIPWLAPRDDDDPSPDCQACSKPRAFTHIEVADLGKKRCTVCTVCTVCPVRSRRGPTLGLHKQTPSYRRSPNVLLYRYTWGMAKSGLGLVSGRIQEHE